MPKKLTHEEFIKRGIEKFGNKIIYPKFVYNGYEKKSIFTCVIHEDFEMTPQCFLNTDHGCPKCAEKYINKKTQQKIIDKGIRKFGDRITYENFTYEKDTIQSVFTCLEHGDFESTPHAFMVSKYGCSKCAIKESHNLQKLTKEEFVKIGISKFNDRITYEKFSYNGLYKLSIFTCKIHGDFETTSSNFLQNKYGCRECGNKSKSFTKEEIINQFIEIRIKMGLELYDYSKFESNGDKTKSIIICHRIIKDTGKLHGEFLQTPSIHKKGHGCPKCNASKGETKTEIFLIKNNIKYERQKKFDNCINSKTNRKIPFDFYLPEYNLLIEFDGDHHYSPEFLNSLNMNRNHPSYYSREKYEDTHFKDQIKNNFCKDNNIPLLRIEFFDKTPIDQLISSFLKNPTYPSVVSESQASF